MSKINLEEHGIAVAGQPDEARLREWAQAGVRTVVNLRHGGEDAMPMPIEAEGELVHSLGMDYVHLPVSMKPPPPEGDGADEKLATAFEKVLAAAREAGPVAVHCKLGQRAGAMVLIALGRHQGWDGATAVGAAEALGLGEVVGNAKLRGYVLGCLG